MDLHAFSSVCGGWFRVLDGDFVGVAPAVSGDFEGCGWCWRRAVVGGDGLGGWDGKHPRS